MNGEKESGGFLLAEEATAAAQDLSRRVVALLGDSRREHRAKV
jgi:hypothetical protein